MDFSESGSHTKIPIFIPGISHENKKKQMRFGQFKNIFLFEIINISTSEDTSHPNPGNG